MKTINEHYASILYEATKEKKTTFKEVFKDTLKLKGEWSQSISVGNIGTSKSLENDWEEADLFGSADDGYDLIDNFQENENAKISVIYDTFDNKHLEIAIKYENKWYYLALSKTPKKILTDILK